MVAKKRQRAAVAALVRRFEATHHSAHHSTALETHADELVADGTVRELIAKYNGMARSAPDFPRSSYSRSKRAASAVASTLRATGDARACDDDDANVALLVETLVALDELVSTAALDDDNHLACTNAERGNSSDDTPIYAEVEAGDDNDTSNDTSNDLDTVKDTNTDNNDTDTNDDTDDDDDIEVRSDTVEQVSERLENEDEDNQRFEEDELSACDETASIHSLTSSCVSDCSFEDDASDASSYYEREFRVHHQMSLLLSPPQLQHVQQKSEGSSENTEAPESTCSTKVVLVEAPVTEASQATVPRTLLPSRIPIFAGSSLRGATSSSLEPPVPITVSKQSVAPPPPPAAAPAPPMHPKQVPSPIKMTPVQSSCRTAPTPAHTPKSGASSARALTSAVSPVQRRKRCEPTTPRKPVERPICPRHATANAPSPCKHADAKRPQRRNSMSETRGRAPAPPAPLSSRSAGASRPSGISPAPSPKLQPPSLLARTMAASPTPGVMSHVRDTSAARVRTRSHDIGTWSSSLIAALERPAAATAPSPSRGASETRPSRIKSRLFDYENDPKRLELIAANRARRRSVDFGSSQAA